MQRRSARVLHLSIFTAIAFLINDRVMADPRSGVSDEIMMHAVSTPNPEYPYAARYYDTEGRGLFDVRISISTGRAKSVKVITSTGSKILDQAAVAGLSHWRFKPGTLPSIRHYSPHSKDPFADQDCRFKVPVTFVMDHRRKHYGTQLVRQPQ